MPPARAGVALPHFTPTAELFRTGGLTLSASSDTVTANVTNQINGATGGLVDVSAVSNGLLVVSVGAVSGTTPTLALFFDVVDFYGNWALTSGATSINGSAITAAGTYAGNISAGNLLTYSGRIRWTITGTAPVFSNVTLDVFGR